MNTKQKALETGSFKCFLLELLSGFEPETSSLPTDWEGEVSCFRVLLCLFQSEGPYSLAHFRPLVPLSRFPVWVTVWVNPSYEAKDGRTSDKGVPRRCTLSRS